MDRFHISTRASRWIYGGRRYDFTWLENRLVPLGFRLVFCWREPDSFEEARRRRLAISSNPAQYNDLALFLKEQEVIQEYVDQSLLPKLAVNLTDNDLNRAADEIADWLEATGGLTEPG